MQASSTATRFPDEEHDRWREAARALAFQASMLRGLVFAGVLGLGAVFALIVLRLEAQMPVAEWSIAGAGALLGVGFTATQFSIRRRVSSVAKGGGWSLVAGALFLFGALAAASFAVLSSGAADGLVPERASDVLRPGYFVAGAHLSFLAALMAALGAPASLAGCMGADGAKRHARGAALLFVAAIVVAGGAYLLRFFNKNHAEAPILAAVGSAVVAIVAIARSLGVSRHLDQSLVTEEVEN